MSNNINSKTIIHIVDDDPSVGLSIVRLLESVGYCVFYFSSGTEYLASENCCQASCIILDMRMPQMSGLQLQKELLKRNSAISIIFLTGYGSIPSTVKAIQSGAIDCIEKPFPENLLLESINRAVSIYTLNCEKVHNLTKLNTRYASLTPRERQVFDHVVQGKPNKSIAVELFISEKTIKIHRSRVMEKMKANSLPSLVKMAMHLMPDNKNICS
jgi:FixJ family two-component response regulator